MRKLIDLTGKKFGRLFVIEISSNKTNQGRPKWNCLCECGSERTVAGQSLRDGMTLSCGCWQRERATESNYTHRLSSHRLYGRWVQMMARCYNKKSINFKYYGGRKIKVCESWKSFENFMDDMDSSYVDGLTIDRKDNDGDYSPDNCRWATMDQQSKNKRQRTSNGEKL